MIHLCINFLLVSLLLVSCSGKQDGAMDTAMDTNEKPTPDASVQIADDPAAMLPRYDLDNPRVLNLPEQLAEISGLAVASDGSLYGHNDEQGIVYRIDPENGTVVERFTLGTIGVEDDFEGIEVVGERFFLVNSKGELYEFGKGADGAHVEFKTIQTGLSAKYDVEGLCFDPTTNALLLACKEYPGKEFKDGDQKTVYAFSLDGMKLEAAPRLVIPVKEIGKALKLKNFKPSGIERHSGSGSYFILSSNAPAIIEVSAEGKLLAMRKLSNLHAQPEGIAIDRSGQLFIGNEGGKLVAIKNSK